ncbi:MAG: CBS domain-containing protein [Alphaproteobacteria bacterium]|nr:CBS domain-containing protein [Alphaproteobacteria bacterium]
MVPVRDIMAVEPQILSADAPVAVAASLLSRWGARPLLVAGGGGRLVGVVGDAELAAAPRSAQRVGEVARTDFVTADGSIDLGQLLVDSRPSPAGLIVVVSSGRPVGSLTDMDFARIAPHVVDGTRLVGDAGPLCSFLSLDESFGVAGAAGLLTTRDTDFVVVERDGASVGVLERIQVERASLAGMRTLSQVLGRTQLPVGQRTTLRSAAHAMVRCRARGIAVTDDTGRVAGVLTVADIVAAVSEVFLGGPDVAVA